MIAALTAAAGCVVKAGALKALAKVEVLIDKTGTLTEGKPRLTDVVVQEQTKADVWPLQPHWSGGPFQSPRFYREHKEADPQLRLGLRTSDRNHCDCKCHTSGRLDWLTDSEPMSRLKVDLGLGWRVGMLLVSLPLRMIRTICSGLFDLNSSEGIGRCVMSQATKAEAERIGQALNGFHSCRSAAHSN